jgi:hypothetical protein
MYVQIITLKTLPDLIPVLRRQMIATSIPLMKRLDGLVDIHLMAHMDYQDVAQVMIYWETEADLHKYDIETFLPKITYFSIDCVHFFSNAIAS